MDLETLFSLANGTAMAGWVLLILLPRWRFATHVVAPVVIPAVLAVTYAVLLVPRIAGADGGFDSLAGVAALFEVEELLLAGWLHYLAFDLFVGSWEVRDARRLGLPHLAVVPCLLGTFLLGPIGLAAYLLLRAAKKRVAVGDA